MALRRRQLDELKRIVENRCVALAAEIHADESRARRSCRHACGRAFGQRGCIRADQIADLGNAELTRDLGELRDMEAAQARLSAGSYGRCIDCHEEIEYARLRAQPGALRCIDCQRIYEIPFQVNFYRY